MGRLLAVDGNSLGHRAFHARAHEAPEGPHVTGTVVRMLASVWAHGPYDAVLVAFDAPHNQRQELVPEYKAHRPEPPAGLREQLATCRRLLGEAGLPVARYPGAEADDLLAAAVDACRARDWACDVLSSDRDLTALVGGDVRLLRPRARMADLAVDDEAAVRRTYGVEPRQYTDLAALRGDPSDGLDGVHGIGPKTAARLLREHDSVPGIYAALHDLAPSVEAALRAGRERVERNLLLMAPLPRVGLDVPAVLATRPDPDRLEEALAAVGLTGAARSLARAMSAPPRPPAPREEPGARGGDVEASPDRSASAVTAPVRRDVPATAPVGRQAALF